MYVRRTAILLLGLALLGCASKSTPSAVSGYLDAARRSYQEGLNELQSGNYQEAIKRFTQVARSPRYFKYSALANLRIADSLFYQNLYDQQKGEHSVYLGLV